MMLKKTAAFVMADSILALIVVSIGIASLLVCQQQLNCLQAKHVVRLRAARLAKEASDEYCIHGTNTAVNRNNYRTIVTDNQVQVYYQGKIVLRISA